MLALIDTCQATVTARGRLCACLEPSALGRLRAVTADARLPAGEEVFVEGQDAEYLYGLRQGAVMLTHRLADGRRQVLSFLFPGDVFGFTAGSRHMCSAIALQRSSFCRIPLSALNTDSQLAARLHQIARACLADALDHAVRLGRMSAKERVADFLFRMWRRMGEPDELQFPFSRVDIADYLGLRPETVSREIASFRRNGLIGPLSSDGIMSVLAPSSLQKFALPR